MLFTSWRFFYLLIATFILYYNPVLKKYQVSVLIVASVIFSLRINVFLLLSVVLVNGIIFLFIANNRSVLSHKRFALLGIFVNIVILSFYKYKSFIASLFISDLSSLGSTSSYILAIPLPVGISFYTFHGISLFADSMRQGKSVIVRDVPKGWKHTILDICLYMLFFPKLISGPIIKATDLFHQIKEKKFEQIDWKSICQLLIAGYFFKTVVSDNLKDYTVWMSFPYFDTLSSSTLIAFIFGYSSQIFADFCGYSLIATGVAKLFGYQLPVNFNFPYISRSFSEFWSRWHISLSVFLRDYLYIPLGGNKISRFRTSINLMVTMTLGGLWHGAAWSYVLWGGAHGMALALERPFRNMFATNVIVNFFRIAVVYLLVSLAWLLFKLPDISHVILYLKAIKNNISLPNNFGYIIPTIVYSVPVVGYHVYHLWRMKKGTMPRLVVELIYAGMLFLIIFQHGSSNSFVYFQF